MFLCVENNYAQEFASNIFLTLKRHYFKEKSL